MFQEWNSLCGVRINLDSLNVSIVLKSCVFKDFGISALFDSDNRGGGMTSSKRLRTKPSPLSGETR